MDTKPIIRHQCFVLHITIYGVNIFKNSYLVKLQNNYKANINMGNLVSTLHKCRQVVAARSLSKFFAEIMFPHVTINSVNASIILEFMQNIHIVFNCVYKYYITSIFICIYSK